MKKSGNLPKKLNLEVDFDYVATLSPAAQRAATYYEYARHSEPLISLVDGLRRTNTFAPKETSVEREKLVKQIAAKPNVLRMDQLLVLAECNGFPVEPFKSAAKREEILKLIDVSFGIVLPCFIPFPTMDAMKAELRRQGLDEFEALENLNPNTVFRVLAIPRHLTMEELIDTTGDLLRSSFSSRFSQAKQPGRKGRSKGNNTSDLLRQLIAFRLDAAGVSCSGPNKLYQSERGREKAVRAAKLRINQMMDHPFFG